MFKPEDFYIKDKKTDQKGRQVYLMESKTDGYSYVCTLEKAESNAMADLVYNDNSRADDEIRNKELFYRALLENAYDSMVVRNKEGVIFYVAPSIKHFGYIYTEWLGCYVSDFIHPDENERFERLNKNLLETPEAGYSSFFRLKCKEGGYCAIELTAKNLLHMPAVGGIVYNFRDITDKKKAEQELEKKERYYRTLIEQSFDVTMIRNKEGKLAYVSPSIKYMLGYEANELLGTSGPEIFTESSMNKLKNCMKKLSSSPGALERTQLELITRDGTLLYTEAIMKNLLENDAIKGYLLMFRDISERIEAEEILKNYNKKLKQEVEERTRELQDKNDEQERLFSNLKSAQVQLIQSEKLASLGQLTAGIAHEINNPINFVSGNIAPLKADFNDLKLLLEKYASLHSSPDKDKSLKEIDLLRQELDVEYLDKEINDLLKGIEEGASRTKEIVSELRNFSRIDEDALKSVDIHQGIDSTLMLLRSKMKDKIHLIKEYDRTIPPIDCYPGKLNQVFMNVISNAIQAIEEEGEIVIKTWQKEKEVFISVKDSGPGMTEEVKEKLFEPFFTTKEVGEGTGLGLSISYAIIEKHGGAIEVHSNPGNGAEFIIKLPFEQKE